MFIRWALTYTWTASSTVLLVQSSNQPILGPPAPPGAPDAGRELMLFLGHIGVFSILVFLFWWSLRLTVSRERSLLMATGFALAFGIVTELVQVYSINRSASVVDLLTNVMVTIVTAGVIATRHSSLSVDKSPA
jgi:VanZ family protein